MFSEYNLKQAGAFTLLRLTCLAWLFAKIISWKVWLPFRTFPLAPPLPFLHAPAAVHIMLLAVSLICLIIITLNSHTKSIRLILLITELLSCSLDQNRWQPWEYQYIFILFVFIVYKNRHAYLFPSIACIVLATYLYSAINKLNSGFLSNVWSDMILHRFFKIEKAHLYNYKVYYAGYVLPLTELLACTGLLFPSTQKIAACFLITIHVFILLLLGPLGLNYNKVVWPWNVLMIAFVCILFIKPGFKKVFDWKKTNKFIAVCWMMLPALHFAGLWDSYLSGGLYAGDEASMVVCVNDNISNLPEAGFFSKGNLLPCNNRRQLNVQNWALNEMNVPAYPEERVYQLVKKEWLQKHASVHASFYIKQPGTLLSKGRPSYLNMQ